MRHNPVFPQDSPWQRCYNDFLRQLSRTHSHATEVAYAGVLSRFFADTSRTPEQYSRSDIEAFIYAKSDKTWTKSGDGAVAGATVNFRLSVISSFYHYASTYEIINTNGQSEFLLQRPSPTTGIKHVSIDRSPKGLTYEELVQLFSVISRDSLIGIRDRAILILTFWSARRRSEIAELLYGDIQATSFPDGKGGTRSGYMYFFHGKGRKTIRDCAELPMPAKEAIDWYLIASGRIDTIQPDDPLFLAIGREEGQGGNVRPGEVRKLTQSAIAKRIVLYARQAGLPHVTLHTLRHTATKTRYESGEDLRSLQHLLRHASISTTDLYIRSLVGTEDPGYKLLDGKYWQL